MVSNLLIGGALGLYLYAYYLQSHQDYYLDILQALVAAEGMVVSAYLGFKLRKTRLSETELKGQEEKLKLYTELMEEAILIREGEFVVEVNDVLARMLGYEASEMIGQKVFQFMDPESSWRNMEWIARGYPQDRFELIAKRKDGTTFPLLVHGSDIIYKGRPMRLSCGWDISELKKMQVKIEESEERFKHFAEVTREGILIHDKGVIVDVNQSLADMLGMEIPDFIGKDSLFFVDEKSAEEVKKFRAGLIPAAPYEITLCHSNGTKIQAETFAAEIFWHGAEMRAVCIWNLTERKKIETALSESRERFQRFAEVTKEGILIHDKGTVLDVNQALLDMLGYPASEVIGRDNFFFMDTESMQKVARFRETGYPNGPYEINLKRTDGTLLPVEAHGTPFSWGGRELRVVRIWNLTERKKNEKALQESQERFKRFAEVAKEGIEIHDHGVIVDANQALADMLGYRVEEMIGKDIQDFSDEKTNEFATPFIKRGEGLPANPTEVTLKRKDGTFFPAEVYGAGFKLNGKDLRVVSLWDITDRKKMEKAILESQERFKRFSEVSKEGILIHENGLIVDANQAAAEMIGYQLAEVVGKPVVEFLNEESAKLAMTYLKEEKYAKAVEFNMIRKDGKEVPIEVTGAGLNIEGRNLRITNFWDLSARKEIEEALRKSEHSFQNLIEKSPDAIIIHTLEKIVYVNDAMLSLLGYSKADGVIGKSPTFFVHPEDTPSVHKRINRLKIPGDYNPPRERRFIRKDGTVLFVDVVSFLIYFEGMPMMVAVARDLTERKKTEEALQKSEKNFRNLIEKSPDGVMIRSLEGEKNLVYVNEGILKFLGYTEEELMGKQSDEILHPASYKDVQNRRTRLLTKSNYNPPEEKAFIRKDGSTAYGEVVSFLVYFEGKSMAVIVVRDLTERKKAEEALKKSEESFRNLIENSPDGVLIHTLDAEPKIIYVNDAIVTLVGYSSDELIGKNADYFVHPKSVTGVRKRIERMMAKEEYNPPQEKLFIHKDGQLVNAEAVSFLIHYEGVPMAAVVIRDLTERKKTEETLMKLERLSTIGEMAAGMAHEIRNPLAAISTAAQILRRKKIKEDSGQLKTILEQSDRLEKLVRDTLDYAKTGAGPNYHTFSIQPILESALNLSQIQFGPLSKNVRIIWDVPQEDIRLNGDPGRIQQILVNLILNSFQIMTQEGVVILKLSSDKDTVFIRVADNGPGISDENMKRIFEPFFTTKAHGSGLGLAISQRIAQEHGGKIIIERLEPKGTAFVLQIPLKGEPQK
jgi:PAS domain S-box-containing protein